MLFKRNQTKQKIYPSLEDLHTNASLSKTRLRHNLLQKTGSYTAATNILFHFCIVEYLGQKMSDVDDELLALAGGDVSSDEEEQHQRQHSGDDNDDDENDVQMNISRSGSESRDDTPEKRKSDTKKTPAKKTKRRANVEEESEEEGEA